MGAFLNLITFGLVILYEYRTMLLNFLCRINALPRFHSLLHYDFVVNYNVQRSHLRMC